MADHLGTEASMLAAQISSNTELVYGSWTAEAITQDAGSPYDEAIDPAEIA
jgi:TatD DNase family protein